MAAEFEEGRASGDCSALLWILWRDLDRLQVDLVKCRFNLRPEDQRPDLAFRVPDVQLFAAMDGFPDYFASLVVAPGELLFALGGNADALPV